MSDADRIAREAMDGAVADTNAWMQANVDRGGVCDFCGQSLQQATEVATFVTDGPIVSVLAALTEDLGAASSLHVMDPEWAACEKCIPVIEQGDAAALVEHVVRVRDPRMPVPDLNAQADMREMYERFFAKNPRKEAMPGGDDHQ